MSSTPSTNELVAIGAPITLRDGSHVRIRQGHHTDRELLRRGFERLSAESRYRRFLAPMKELTESTVRYLTEIDHHDHEAMIALDEQTGEGIGVARYVRDPDHPDVAEVAVTVIDDWQGRGLGTLLLEVISARARGGHHPLHCADAGRQQGDDGSPSGARPGADRRSRAWHRGDRSTNPCDRTGARAETGDPHRGATRRRDPAHPPPPTTTHRRGRLIEAPSRPAEWPASQAQCLLSAGEPGIEPLIERLSGRRSRCKAAVVRS
jgi:GNAT superfamily N-acetyltransferase